MRLQKFGQEPKGKSFDWNDEILELVRKKFTTQTIFDKYVLPALEKAKAMNRR
ncbi:hypothetical protein FACS189485_02100 [Spirochaetia bacterium]|nr:hypothetical protein FACS189485_02100 [Spirochaetia bacterium]